MSINSNLTPSFDKFYIEMNAINELLQTIEPTQAEKIKTTAEKIVTILQKDEYSPFLKNLAGDTKKIIELTKLPENNLQNLKDAFSSLQQHALSNFSAQTKLSPQDSQIHGKLGKIFRSKNYAKLLNEITPSIPKLTDTKIVNQYFMLALRGFEELALNGEIAKANNLASLIKDKTLQVKVKAEIYLNVVDQNKNQINEAAFEDIGKYLKSHMAIVQQISLKNPPWSRYNYNNLIAYLTPETFEDQTLEAPSPKTPPLHLAKSPNALASPSSLAYGGRLTPLTPLSQSESLVNEEAESTLQADTKESEASTSVDESHPFAQAAKRFQSSREVLDSAKEIGSANYEKVHALIQEGSYRAAQSTMEELSKEDGLTPIEVDNLNNFLGSRLLQLLNYLQKADKEIRQKNYPVALQTAFEIIPPGENRKIFEAAFGNDLMARVGIAITGEKVEIRTLFESYLNESPEKAFDLAKHIGNGNQRDTFLERILSKAKPRFDLVNSILEILLEGKSQRAKETLSKRVIPFMTIAVVKTTDINAKLSLLFNALLIASECENSQAIKTLFDTINKINEEEMTRSHLQRFRSHLQSKIGELNTSKNLILDFIAKKIGVAESDTKTAAARSATVEEFDTPEIFYEYPTSSAQAVSIDDLTYGEQEEYIIKMEPGNDREIALQKLFWNYLEDTETALSLFEHFSDFKVFIKVVTDVLNVRKEDGFIKHLEAEAQKLFQTARRKLITQEQRIFKYAQILLIAGITNNDKLVQATLKELDRYATGGILNKQSASALLALRDYINAKPKVATITEKHIVEWIKRNVIE